MGVDFVSGKAKHFSKGWNREAAALARADLLTTQPQSERRLIQGELRPGMQITIGEVLVARLTDQGLVAYRREVAVVTFDSPPSAHDSPHFHTAPKVSAKTGSSASTAVNRSTNGSSLGSGMVGMSS